MCGIIGYTGNRTVKEILIQGLHCLEYRGYDSAGIAVLQDGKLKLKKVTGRVGFLEQACQNTLNNAQIGIAHTRWATHGGANIENAHPHTDCKERIAIVHNGIIENYTQLKQKLIDKGHRFSSQTDSEVIAHLIEDNYNGDVIEAIVNTLKVLEGTYALCMISKEEPDKLIAVRKESPLIIGIGRGENFIASDIQAVLRNTKDIVFLENNEIALITKNCFKVFNLDGEEINKEINTIKWDSLQAERGGYSHFMLKEICEQSRVVEETINGRVKNGTIHILEEIGLSNEEILNINRIVIVACGTSWHAGLVGEFMLEELARINTEVEYASEFRYRHPIIDDGTLVIAISQSGETADTLAALKEAKQRGAKVISICNVIGSSIARESDGVIYTRAGPEVGVASTKAFTTQLVVLYLITNHFGKIKGLLTEEQLTRRVRDLRKLPLQIQAVLDDTDYIKFLAEKFYEKSNALYLGRGINFPIALEGALKLKEISYIHAEGYPAAEMKHGPIALIDRAMPVIFIATKDNRTYKKVLGNIEEVKSRGGMVVAVATKEDNEIRKKVNHVLYIPQNSYILTPILGVIPLQLLAYYIAVMRGCDVDKPRNLAKSVTVE